MIAYLIRFLTYLGDIFSKVRDNSHMEGAKVLVKIDQNNHGIILQQRKYSASYDDRTYGG